MISKVLYNVLIHKHSHKVNHHLPVMRYLSYAMYLVLLFVSLLSLAQEGTAVSPPSPQEQQATIITAGKAALEDGLYELAQKQFERCLDQKRGSPKETEEVVILLVRSLYEQQKYDKILEILKPRGRWVGEIPDSGAFVFWRALAKYEVGKFNEALVELEGFEDKHKGETYVAQAKRLLAWCYLKADKTDRALEEFAGFDRAYGNLPEAPANLLEWAKTLIVLKRLDAAQEVLSRLVKIPGDLKPVHDGHYWLGQVLIEEKKWDAAANVLTSLAQKESARGDLRAEAFFSLAVVYEAQGNRNQATNALSKGIELAPSRELKTKGGFEIGSLLIDMGYLEAGIPVLKAHISASPDDPLAGTMQLKLAESLLNHERYKEAVDEFQQYLETFTNTTGQAQAYYGRGWGLINIARHAEAATAFFKAYSLFTESSWKERCLFKVGDAYFANGQYKLAGETYQRVLSEFPDSKLVPDALFQFGESMVYGNEPGKAEKIFFEIAEKYPATRRAEEALLRVAEIKKKQDHWLEAIEAFNNVMNIYSNGAFFAEALHGRGLVRYDMLKFGEALEDFERVVKDFPKSAAAEQAYYMRGMCYFWTGRDNEALMTCRAFIDLYPDSQWAPEVLFWIGKYEYNQKNYEAAEKEFMRFVQKYPDDPMADECLLRAGRAASNRKEYVRAIELFTKLVKDYSSSEKMPEVRFAQADALSELAKFSGAILIFEEIINKYPDNKLLIASAWGRKGDCQFALGVEDPKRYEESMGSYRVVVNSSNVNLDLVMQAEYKIGKCLEKLGRTEEAFEQYYLKVIVRYFEDWEKGVWHNEASKVWFTRAVFNAADIMGARKDWRRVVSILERIISADVPAAEEARERIRKIRAEHWWLFY